MFRAVFPMDTKLDSHLDLDSSQTAKEDPLECHAKEQREEDDEVAKDLAVRQPKKSSEHHYQQLLCTDPLLTSTST
jgi:hypothetical protein